VAGAGTVFVVPAGSLNLVSFASLPLEKTWYLVEKGPLIHDLHAERDLVAVPAKKAGGRAGGERWGTDRRGDRSPDLSEEQWAVLSASDTEVGAVKAWEGVVGLRRGGG
jgi:hypothetical protein